jgi:hypothetical protein
MQTSNKQNIDQNTIDILNVKIERFISSILTLTGLRKNKDFTVSETHLHVNKNPVRGKLIHTLKHYYPQYNFYWETPKDLYWF